MLHLLSLTFDFIEFIKRIDALRLFQNFLFKIEVHLANPSLEDSFFSNEWCRASF